MKRPVDLFFEALSNRNRFRILQELSNGEKTVSELESKLKIEQTSLSHHLTCLLNCRFVNVRKNGRNRIYSIEPEAKELLAGISSHVKRYEAYLRKCGVLRHEHGKV